MPETLPPKTINLALQGGGSHGAFTWGVLDRLLQDEQLTIEGISGASAGAMNAAIMIDGYSKGGREGARHKLDRFWNRIGELGAFSLPHRTFIDKFMGNWNIDASPAAMMTGLMQQVFSPYQANPFNFNPLRDLIREMLDLDAMRAYDSIKLFVSATNVETGRIRVFQRKELTIDMLMASACLPFTFQATMIDGHPYWDGGYVGNPALFPLIYNCDSPDIMVVQVNPMSRPGIPDTPSEIVNRLDEISFNASLIGELRAIAFVQRLIECDHLKNDEAARLKLMNMHIVSAEDQMRVLGAASKSNTDLDFLLFLKAIGQKTADAWLQQNRAAIGVSSSVDLKELLA